MKKYFVISIFVILISTVELIGFDPITYEQPRLYLMTNLSVIGIFAIIFRKLLNRYRLPVSPKVFMFFIGAFFGLIRMLSRESKFSKYISLVYTINPQKILNIVLPILVFKVSFCIDAHTFVRAWLQVFLISVFGLVMTTVFIGSLVMAIMDVTWSITYFKMALACSVCCTPIYPDELVKLLKEIERSKHLNILLEGEAIIGTANAVVLFRILLGSVEGYVSTWYQFFTVFLRFFAGGIVIGVIVGKVTCRVIGTLSYDALSMMATTIVASCFSYYLCQDVFSVSGVIAVCIIGLMLSIERSRFPDAVDQFLATNWELLSFLVDNTVFCMFGVITIKVFVMEATVGDYALMLVTYILVGTGRFLSFILLAPILSRIGYGLTFRNLVIAVWGGFKGSATICLTIVCYTHPYFKPVSKDLAVQMTGIVLLTLLINCGSSETMLNVLGFYDLSLARKSNMSNCVRLIQNKRERSLTVLKMDRYLGDANWPLVEKTTLFQHPYRISMKDNDEDDDYYLGYRFTVCPDCKIELAAEPSGKELMEMTREARIRVLKANKISYSKQFEDAILAKDSFRILTQVVEISMDSTDCLMNIDGLCKLFHRQGCEHFIRRRLLRLYYEKSKEGLRVPQAPYNRRCYRIVTRRAFEPIISAIIVLTVIPVVIELSVEIPRGSANRMGLTITHFILFFLFAAECHIRVCAYAYVRLWADGVKTYFKSGWNIFDFCLLISGIFDMGLDVFDLIPVVDYKRLHKNPVSAMDKVALTVRLLRQLRLVRLLKLCRCVYPRLVHCLDNRINRKLKHAYDLGKGFVLAQQEVTEKLFHMIDNKDIREDMRQTIQDNKLAVMYELGLVQKDKPSIAVTLKTKNAIMAVLNGMYEAVYELKICGWVDDMEYAKLMDALNSRYKAIRFVRKVQPNPPPLLFKAVAWMGDEEPIIDFLYANVHTKVFDPGDIICSVGEKSEGIFIILTGIFKLSYVPRLGPLKRLKDNGELPVVDYINTLHFHEKSEDYIFSGNTFGELGVLTGRLYCCNVTAASPSQAFVISHEVMNVAIDRSKDHTKGLSSRMWKCIMMKLASAILVDVPHYQTMRRDKIQYQLERAFVPDLSRFKVFATNELMEDVLLIEGVVLDFNTNDTFVAPCHIPRNVQKIQLIHPGRSQVFDPDTKIMIIPIQEAEEYEIMEMSVEFSEMVSALPPQIMVHTAAHEKARRKRKRKKLMHERKRKMSQSYLSGHSIETRKSMAMFGYSSHSLDIKSFSSSFTKRSSSVIDYV